MNEHSTLPSLVVVGNGMVAGRLLDELLTRMNNDGATAYKITVIGAEPHGCYNRIMLSSVLAKDATMQSIVQKDHQWYKEHNIDFLAGSPVVNIDKTAKCVETADGQKVSYDELIIATGSNAATIPAKNLNLNNIFTFRTLGDTRTMMDIADGAQKALVVGGGLLGLEAAYGLAKFGISVTLVHRSAWLLNRQLDKAAASMLKAVMSAMGIEFKLSDEVASFNGEGKVDSATLKSGETIDIDMAVIATGIKPNAKLGLATGLRGERAIHVNDYMQTSETNISALGECIEHDGQTFGLVDPLWRQAETLAARLIHNENLPFENQAIATKLKVSGVQVFSAGVVDVDVAKPGWRAVVVSDPKANIYRKLLIQTVEQNGASVELIKGAVLFGDVRSGQYYFELMQNNTNVSAMLPTLIFGEAYLAAPDSKTIAA